MAESHTSAEVVGQRLREAILSSEFLPGDKLHQDRLAEMLGISRTPVRAALTMLAQSGLVSYESNRGFYVREFSLDEVAAAFQVRAELEAMACRLACRTITPPVIARLNALVEEGDRLLAPGTLLPEHLADYRRMNVNFHGVIMGCANNPWIQNFVASLHNVPGASDRVIMWRDYEVLARSHDDHRRIAHALAQHQGERAASIMREHVTFALEHLQQQIQLHPQDFLRMPGPTPPAKGRSARNRKSAE